VCLRYIDEMEDAAWGPQTDDPELKSGSSGRDTKMQAQSAILLASMVTFTQPLSGPPAFVGRTTSSSKKTTTTARTGGRGKAGKRGGGAGETGEGGGESMGVDDESWPAFFRRNRLEHRRGGRGGRDGRGAGWSAKKYARKLRDYLRSPTRLGRDVRRWGVTSTRGGGVSGEVSGEGGEESGEGEDGGTKRGGRRRKKRRKKRRRRRRRRKTAEQ
jgi:hypothetical protein